MGKIDFSINIYPCDYRDANVNEFGTQGGEP